MPVNVRIGSGCRVGHLVVIHPDTVVGNEARIDDHATLGKLPMRAANSATTKEQELPPLTGVKKAALPPLLFTEHPEAHAASADDLASSVRQIAHHYGQLAKFGVSAQSLTAAG